MTSPTSEIPTHPDQSEADGPNAGRIDPLENGDEEVSSLDGGDAGSDDELRDAKDILEAYMERRDKVWWNGHQHWLQQIESGERPVTDAEKSILKRANQEAQRIENEYGRTNLEQSDWGLLYGQLSALAWVTGTDWEESLDT